MITATSLRNVELYLHQAQREIKGDLNNAPESDVSVSVSLELPVARMKDQQNQLSEQRSAQWKGRLDFTSEITLPRKFSTSQLSIKPRLPIVAPRTSSSPPAKAHPSRPDPTGVCKGCRGRWGRGAGGGISSPILVAWDFAIKKLPTEPDSFQIPGS